jgi:hypothetical protein
MRKRGNSLHKRLHRRKQQLIRPLKIKLQLMQKPSNLRLLKIRRRLKKKRDNCFRKKQLKKKQSLIKRLHKLLSLSQVHNNSHQLNRFLLKMLKSSLYQLVKSPQ